MNGDLSASTRVPSLSHFCHKAVLAQIDAFEGFGALPYEMIEPILQQCSGEALLRLETNSQDLSTRTQPCWKSLCTKDHPVEMAKILEGYKEEPPCWRDFYLELEVAREQRLEAVGERIRGQRQEAEETKKERQTVLIRPMLKRARTTAKSASLFDRTRKDSIKMQKTMLGPNMGSSPLKPKPRIPATSLSLGVSGGVKATSPISPTSRSTPSAARPPSLQSRALTVEAPRAGMIKKRQKMAHSDLSTVVNPSFTPARPQPPPPPLRSSADTSPASSPPPPSGKRRDPVALMFIPKHRAHSQRPLVPPSGAR